jgi:NADH-quinone oxidoreductase subunit F
MKVTKLYHLEDIAESGKKQIEGEKTQLIFGLSTCGIAAGGKDLIDFANEYILNKGIDVDLRSVGCIGMCYAEPLVDVKLPHMPRLTYCNVDKKLMNTILEEHVIKGNPLYEYAMAQLSEEISESKYNPIYFNDRYQNIKVYKEIPFFSKQVRIVLHNCGIINPKDIQEYIARGGYRALYKTLYEMKPQKVIDEVKSSGLKGRGGAGFPTGLKWEFCFKARGDEKYIICNADEGDPGAYMDRAVLEGDPHSVIEGMIIGAYAMGATAGFIYVRAEYPLAIEHLRIAISEAEKYGLLGERIFGTDFNFNIHIREGGGVFVCGEETALINSIEGKRGEPRPRPPFPASKGLWGKPTNINNVETWANIPMIIQRGSEWFSSIGVDKKPGTKVFSLVGKINRSGLIEVPLGLPLRDIVFEIGGGLFDNKNYKAVQTGGPSGGCIPAQFLDTPVDYDSLRSIGSIMGSGGMVVMDEDTCMVDVARYFLSFTSEESCGKCVPCRIGTRKMLSILEDICKGVAKERDIALLEELCVNINKGALCGLGQTAPNPVLTTLKYFKEEYFEHIKNKKCPSKQCTNLIKYEIDTEKCTGCTLCARVCPAEAINGERKKTHSISLGKCVKCGKCYEVCNFGAVKKIDLYALKNSA